MRRREFIGVLGIAAVWTAATSAQEAVRLRRIGVLQDYAEDDQDAHLWFGVFRNELQRLGWREGHNIRIDERWAAGSVERRSGYAADLVRLRPDVLFGEGTPIAAALQKAAGTVPIVFVGASNPVAWGFVKSVAKPGGNMTGFVSFEPALGGKWLETLKEIAPGVLRVALLFNPETHSGQYFESIEGASHRSGVEVVRLPFRSEPDLERAIAEFARQPNGGLVVLADTGTNVHREKIIWLASEHRLPAVYAHRLFTSRGGLISYGPDRPDQYRRAADYVDRILRGARPDELPVQSPIKFELIVNAKTAIALGLTIPPALLARADELIE
jgi:putative tryptophan/tyrosine transport system substrate-binding protein